MSDHIPNLDSMDVDDLAAFSQTSRQDLAERIFPDRPAGYLAATRTMAEYAERKAAGIRCRAAGDIPGAMIAEGRCEWLYVTLPVNARW